MKTSELKTVIKDKVNMFELLGDYGITTNDKDLALCIYHQESNPSMAVYDTRVLDTHDGESNDVIAVYMYLNNLSNGQFRQALTEMYEKYISNTCTAKTSKVIRVERGEPKIAYKKKKAKRINNLAQADADFIPYEDLNEFDKARIEEEMRQRGIPNAITDLLGCGYNIGLDKSFKISGYMHNLIYKLNGFYIKRGMYSNFKGNAGTSQPTKLHQHKRSKDWIVVEGITDALSILELNRSNGTDYNAISLNSVANINKFIKSINIEQAKAHGFKFYTLLDNDDAGAGATGKLISFLQANGLNYEIMPMLDGTKYKDINARVAGEAHDKLYARYRAVGLC